jgi:hypothetical protein
MVALLALLKVCEVVAKSDVVVASSIILPFSEANDVLDPAERKSDRIQFPS